MGIFNLNETSNNEFLNEHGGAHRRYLDMLAKKDELAKKKMKITANRNTYNDLSDERRILGLKAQKYSFGKDEDRKWNKAENVAADANGNAARLKGDDTYKYHVGSASDTARLNRENEKNNSASGDIKYRRAGKRAFKQDFGGKKSGSNFDIETKMARKRAVKEACEYILSILDEE